VGNTWSIAFTYVEHRGIYMEHRGSSITSVKKPLLGQRLSSLSMFQVDIPVIFDFGHDNSMFRVEVSLKWALKRGAGDLI
jgi:hypothetical protein